MMFVGDWGVAVGRVVFATAGVAVAVALRSLCLCTDALHQPGARCWLRGTQVWPVWEAGKIENKLPPWQEEEMQRQRLSTQKQQQRLGGGQQRLEAQAQQPPAR
jgi:hypothetical protein